MSHALKDFSPGTVVKYSKHCHKRAVCLMTVGSKKKVRKVTPNDLTSLHPPLS